MPSTTGPNNAVAIRDRLRSNLTRAMKNREQARVTVIRTVLAAIDSAEAVEIAETGQGTIGYADVTRRSLSREQLAGVLQTELDEREESATGYDRVGRTDHAEELRWEIGILCSYLETT